MPARAVIPRAVIDSKGIREYRFARLVVSVSLRRQDHALPNFQHLEILYDDAAFHDQLVRELDIADGEWFEISLVAAAVEGGFRAEALDRK